MDTLIKLFHSFKCLVGFHYKVRESAITCDSRDNKPICLYCYKTLKDKII